MKQERLDLVDWLEKKLAEAELVPEILERAPALSDMEAYRIQQALIECRVAEGDRVIGYKAALTSKAMQTHVGVNEPVLGTLLNSRLHTESSPISLNGFIQATLEPEVGVLMKTDLTGPGATWQDAVAAVEGYIPSVELGDIRIGDNRRSLQQTIVCNTFNGGHVFGSRPVSPQGIDLRLEGMVLTVNGEVRDSATAVEVLGDPINSVVFLANKLTELGLSLKAGMFVLTGSIVKSVAIKPGDEVRVDFTRLGSILVRFCR